MFNIIRGFFRKNNKCQDCYQRNAEYNATVNENNSFTWSMDVCCNCAFDIMKTYDDCDHSSYVVTRFKV